MITVHTMKKEKLVKKEQLTEKEFLQEAQLWVFTNHKTQVAAANYLGITPQYLYTILKGINPPTVKLLKAMGIEKLPVVKTRAYKRIK